MPINFPPDEFKKELSDTIKWVEDTKKKYIPGQGHVPTLIAKEKGTPSLEEIMELQVAFSTPLKDLKGSNDDKKYPDGSSTDPNSYPEAGVTTEDGEEMGGEEKPPNKWLNTIKNDIEYIDNIDVFLKLLIDYTYLLEEQFSREISRTNEFLQFPKKAYKLATEKYNLKKNSNSSNKILKMDSYDKNIEENFFIMYYLLSYGILGFFIYKLLKL